MRMGIDLLLEILFNNQVVGAVLLDPVKGCLEFLDYLVIQLFVKGIPELIFIV